MLTCKENLYTDVLGSSESNLRNGLAVFEQLQTSLYTTKLLNRGKKAKVMLIHFLLIYVSCYHLLLILGAQILQLGRTSKSYLRPVYGTSVFEPKALIKNSVAAECKLCY